MKTQKLIELERERLDLIDEIRALHDAFDADKASAKDFEAQEAKERPIYRKIDMIDLDIAEERLNASERNKREAKRPGTGSRTARGVDDGEGYGADINRGWQDSSGKEIRSLTKAESVAKDRWEGPELGNILRAMVTGPRTDAEKRALAEGTDSAGGYTVPAPLAQKFIDKLRARSVLIRAGALTVPMDSATLAIAKLASDPTAEWKAENAVITASNPTFDRVLLEAKTLIGLVKLSRELAEDSANVSQMLEAAFVGAASVEFDRAGLFGSGGGQEPLGIANQNGIGTVSMGTNGAALTNFDPLIDGGVQVLEANAEPGAAVMSPRTAGELAKLKDANGNPLRKPAMLDPIAELITTSVPNDQTQGTADNATSIVMGDWRQLIIGLRSELRIELLRETFAGNHQYGFVFHMRGDFQPAHANAFSAVEGIIPA